MLKVGSTESAANLTQIQEELKMAQARVDRAKILRGGDITTEGRQLPGMGMLRERGRQLATRNGFERRGDGTRVWPRSAGA